MDGDNPRGGKWSYDSENKKITKKFSNTKYSQIQETNHTKLKDIKQKNFQNIQVILKISGYLQLKKMLKMVKLYKK